MKTVSIMLVATSVITLASASITLGTHQGFDCLVCHNEEPTPNIADIRTEIVTPNSGVRTVVFTLPGCYVSEAIPVDGVCQVCHTVTALGGDPSSPVWRNDGTGMDHGGLGFGTDCTACHLHQDDFLPLAGGIGASHDTHISDTFKGPKKWSGSAWVNLECIDCHGAAPMPLLADGQDLANTTVCDDCHSPAGYFDGVNNAVIGAKPNWVSAANPSLIYNPSGTGLNVGKKDWCLGCHDQHGGTCQIANVYAPAVAGDNSSYGYKVSGHGSPDIHLECEDCHNLALVHIDGLPRTYSSSSFPNNYKLGYRLNRDMIVPRDFETKEEGAFDLCTYSCHNYDALAGSTTNFRGGFAPNYCAPGMNFHYVHLDAAFANICGDSDFDGTADSSQTCILCHNVHGSRMHNESNPSIVAPSPVMIRDGLLISTPGTTDKVPAFDFKWYEGDCNTQGTVGPQTTNFNESRWGGMLCGQSPDDLSINNVCWGCHLTGKLNYYRVPSTPPTIFQISPRQQEPTVPYPYMASWLTTQLGYPVSNPRWGRVAIYGENFGAKDTGDEVRIGDPLGVDVLNYNTDIDFYTVEDIDDGIGLKIGLWRNDLVGVYLFPAEGEIVAALYGPGNPGLGTMWLDKWLGLWVVKGNGSVPVASNIKSVKIRAPLPD